MHPSVSHQSNSAMINRNTEDIDKLFREGLNPEESLLTVPEGEWPKLERRLVRHEQKKRGIIWFTRLGGVAALLLLFFSLRLFMTDETEQVVQKPRMQQAAPEQDTGQVKTPQEEQTTTNQQNQSQRASRIPATVRDTAQGFSNSVAQNKDREQTPGNRRTVADVQDKATAGRDTPQESELRVPQPTEETTAGLPKAESMTTVLSPADSIPPTDQRSSATDEPLLAVTEEPERRPKAEPLVRKLTLSVLAAPDLNGVDNLNNASLGSDFGLLVSFAIAKNWSFSTGGIYAKKLYESGYRDYNPAKDIWGEYYPRSVDADCRVLDIPLNISYTFLRGKNSSFSAGSGISSYIMLREDYRFTYAVTDPDNRMDYQVVNENQHWLSVVNLQATFEQRLSARLSLSLQPYMKVPLGAVGFAGVKLHTLGMAANLNWNFNL